MSEGAATNVDPCDVEPIVGRYHPMFISSPSCFVANSRKLPPAPRLPIPIVPPSPKVCGASVDDGFRGPSPFGPGACSNVERETGEDAVPGDCNAIADASSRVAADMRPPGAGWSLDYASGASPFSLVPSPFTFALYPPTFDLSATLPSCP